MKPKNPVPFPKSWLKKPIKEMGIGEVFKLDEVDFSHDENSSCTHPDCEMCRESDD